MNTADLQRELDQRLTRIEALVAAKLGGTVKRVFDELLHPRGRDGRFIEKGGSVKGSIWMSDTPGDRSAGRVRIGRGDVVDILPNDSDPNDPFIKVKVGQRDGWGLASELSQAADTRARLDSPMAPANPEESLLPEADFNLPEQGRRKLTGDDIQAAMEQDGEATTTDDIEEALQLLAEGKKVKLTSEDQVTVLLDRMLEVVNDAIEKGEKAPLYDLCNVTVENTNLFCVESKGIERIDMPQLKGVPLPGSKAAAMEPDSRGEVDLEAEFRKHLEGLGVQITDLDLPASHLKASQSELNGGKTAGIASAIENGTYDEARLFVSNDNYIVDGHHRWSASLGVDMRDGHAGDIEMPVAQIDMDILELLAEANRFAEEWGIPQSSAGDQTRKPNVDSEPELPDRKREG